MTAPANDLAAKIAEAIHEVAALEGDLSLSALRAIIGTHLAPTLDELAAAQAELAQTRENLYAGLDRNRDDITTPHLATVAVNALARERDARSRAEADCAALRAIVQGDLESFDECSKLLNWENEPPTEQEKQQRARLTDALATDAGKPLLDELARLRETLESVYGVIASVWEATLAGGSRHHDWDLIYSRMGALMEFIHPEKIVAFKHAPMTCLAQSTVDNLQQRAEAAESALRLAKPDSERLDFVETCWIHSKAQHMKGDKWGVVVAGRETAFGDSLREAIDAAMQAARQKLPEVGP